MLVANSLTATLVPSGLGQGDGVWGLTLLVFLLLRALFEHSSFMVQHNSPEEFDVLLLV